MSGILSNLKNLKQRNVNAPPCFLIIDMVTIVQLKRLTEISARRKVCAEIYTWNFVGCCLIWKAM